MAPVASMVGLFFAVTVVLAPDTFAFVAAVVDVFPVETFPEEAKIPFKSPAKAPLSPFCT